MMNLANRMVEISAGARTRLKLEKRREEELREEKRRRDELKARRRAQKMRGVWLNQIRREAEKGEISVVIETGSMYDREAVLLTHAGVEFLRSLGFKANAYGIMWRTTPGEEIGICTSWSK